MSQLTDRNEMYSKNISPQNWSRARGTRPLTTSRKALRRHRQGAGIWKGMLATKSVRVSDPKETRDKWLCCLLAYQSSCWPQACSASKYLIQSPCWYPGPQLFSPRPYLCFLSPSFPFPYKPVIPAKCSLVLSSFLALPSPHLSWPN